MGVLVNLVLRFDENVVVNLVHQMKVLILQVKVLEQQVKVQVQQVRV
jgi:hypothetical protein